MAGLERLGPMGVDLTCKIARITSVLVSIHFAWFPFYKFNTYFCMAITLVVV